MCYIGGPPAWGNATGTASPPLPAVNGTMTSKAPRSSQGMFCAGKEGLGADAAFRCLANLVRDRGSRSVICM